MMHHILTFTWSLTALLGAVAMNAGDDPEDPFLWLEDVLGERPMVWVKERNAESLGALARSEEFRVMEGRIRGILDSDERIPTIEKEGDYYYNFWRDARNPRGLWRRTTLDEYRKDKTAWEVVLDLDALARREGENWVWHGAEVLRPGHRRALISLSRGGADAAVVREFDMEKKAFIADGYTLPEAKSRVAWRDEDSVFVGTDFGPGSLTDSGYPRIVKEWRRGTPLASAATVYEGLARDMGVEATAT
jgi:prolyl oligopeptidase